MIKEIEELSPKLQAKRFVEPSVFDDCEVRVIETRSDNHVTPQAAEARHRREPRSIEPLFNRADRCDRSRHVGPQRVGDPRHSTITGDDVNRTATLNLNDRSQLPTIEQPVAAKRQVVDSAKDESMPRVKVGKPAVVLQVVTILSNPAAGAVTR
jgi:hypothetical protein